MRKDLSGSRDESRSDSLNDEDRSFIASCHISFNTGWLNLGLSLSFDLISILQSCLLCPCGEERNSFIVPVFNKSGLVEV